ncbi:3-methyladenine DNA glycosylase [Nocardioides limicola]|uniref:3-methyladenine DNA glycosylase n=1 Tax=Nocardioides limicola TaxID=2803368 RepID=UPI0027DE0E59|nr:3-methyladenine DNA glycosylase [Nocardioides sp. DJM-14]
MEIVLDRAEWSERARAHAARLAPYIDPHLARREDGVRHPVHDFLFTYYSQRPNRLLRWHPGFGVGLAEAEEYAGLKGYVDAPVTVSPTYVASQRPLIETLHRLLSATLARPAHLGCFGLHEWAMVHRLDEDEVRHRGWPLRLGGAATDEVVASHRIACSHFDAFRFFTPTARPLNTLSPGRDDRADFEQPGCLHAGMDLYKHAFRLSPMISSDLVADCFELAWDIRILDMRAAPYDLTGIRLDPSGEAWTPVRIETAAGKQEYVDAQARFAERAAPLRGRLIEDCERLIATSP